MLASLTLRSLLKFFGITLGLIAIALYTLFQARYLIMGPQIVLIEQPPFLNNERQIHFSGTAFNITHLWLNDRQIYTDADGNFTEALVLENGYTVATLRAEDRYGRITTVRQPLVYVPASFTSYNN